MKDVIKNISKQNVRSPMLHNNIRATVKRATLSKVNVPCLFEGLGELSKSISEEKLRSVLKSTATNIELWTDQLTVDEVNYQYNPKFDDENRLISVPIMRTNPSDKMVRTIFKEAATYEKTAFKTAAMPDNVTTKYYMEAPFKDRNFNLMREQLSAPPKNKKGQSKATLDKPEKVFPPYVSTYNSLTQE